MPPLALKLNGGIMLTLAEEKQYYKHGLTKHLLYSTWRNMRDRCNYIKHPSYKDYGARGIKVCRRWDNFALFLADMGERPSPQYSLDRIDNDGDYTPENCRWATKSEQQSNQRLRRDNRSGHKGIYWYPKYNKWQVQVRRKTVGYFETKQEAIDAKKLWRDDV